MYKTAKSCVLWENSWADTLESGYIMATKYRRRQKIISQDPRAEFLPTSIITYIDLA